MRIPLLLCAILMSFTGLSQTAVLLNYDAISNFDWSLFQGKVNQLHVAEMGDNTAAVTVSSISYNARQTTPNTVTVVINARFHVSESWTKYPDLPDPEGALNHEKRHLDITEIYARQLRQAISETTFTERNFKAGIEKLFQDIVAMHRQEQIRYDTETDHSADARQQEIWNIAIDQTLQELTNYAQTMLIIHLEQ